MGQFAIPALAVGGLLGGIFGGSQAASGARDAAQAQIQAGREARADYGNSTDEGMYRALIFALGPEQARQYLATLPRERRDRLVGRPASQANFTDQQRSRLQEIDARLAQGPAAGSGAPAARRPGQNARGQVVNDQANWDQERARLEQERADLMRAAGEDPGQTGIFDQGAVDAMGPGFITDMERFAEQFRGQGAESLGRYDADTSRLMTDARRIENNAQHYGQGRAAEINRDAERASTGAARQIQSRLAGSGLANSSMLGEQIGGATRNIFEGQQSALNSLGDSQTQLMSGLAGNRLNLDSSRASGRTSLDLGLQDRDISMSSAPLNTRMQVLTGNTFNPMLGQDTTRYYPGVSPGGAAASTWGNALGAMGGQAMNLGLMGLLAQDPNFRSMYGR